MRRVVRSVLDKRSISYLRKRQEKINIIVGDAEFDANLEWNKSRKTKSIISVLSSLKLMMGDSERCMYCHDSHGSDIDHFWPKTPYPQRMFDWENLLLCCTECGRAKGDVFPVTEEVPLLVNPTVDEPWLFIDFDPDIGVLVPVFDATTNALSLKGEATVTLLKLDRREALQSVYLRTWRRLRGVVDAILQGGVSAVDAYDSFIKEDDHGLLGWCIVGNGQRVEPFQTLWAQRRDVWDMCKIAYDASVEEKPKTEL